MDREEFRDFWMPHSERFYRVAYHILENREDARDAVQDLFIRLWKIPSVATMANPAAYAMTILRNLCLDRVRHAAVVRAETMDESLPLEDRSAAADRALETEETVRRLASAMSGLSEKQRKLIKLRLVKGMAYNEISQITGISELSLRVMLSTTRKQLKNKLGRK